MSLVAISYTFIALHQVCWSLSASVALHTDNEVKVYVSRDGGDEWSGPIAESDNWRYTLKFTVDDVTLDTRFRFNCTDIHTHSVGGFIASLTFNGETYSTTNPIEDSNYILVYASDGVYEPLVYNNITNGIWHDVYPNLDLEVASNAYWIWNENVYNKLIFEFDFSKNNIIPTPAPTTCFNSIHDWIIDDIGKSSQFRFTTPCHNSKQFIKVKMVSLTEYDSLTGRKTRNKITSFAPHNWYWITDEDTQYNGYDATINKYVSTFGINNNEIEFNLTTILFYENGHLNGTDPFFENTLKWTTDINNWPFLNDENTLELCINVMSNVGASGKDNNDENNNNNNNTRFTFNDFEFILEDNAKCIVYCDIDCDVDIIDTMDVSVYKYQKNSNHLDICFTFKRCNGVINHDPFVRFITNDNNNQQLMTNEEKIDLIIGSVIFVFILVLFLVSFYYRRNKRLQTNISLINDNEQSGGYDTINET